VPKRRKPGVIPTNITDDHIMHAHEACKTFPNKRYAGMVKYIIFTLVGCILIQGTPK